MVTLPLQRLIEAQALPATEQAAMLFAQGHDEVAQRLLEDELAGNHVTDPRPWNMLFALLRARGDWRRYDQLSVQYGSATGLPPPTWLERAPLEHLPPELQVGGAAYVELYRADADLAQRLTGIGERHASLHLDLTRLEPIDAADALRLAELIESLSQATIAVIVSGTEQVSNRLRQLLEHQPAELALWRLLLALYRVQGMQSDFERVALEYALATGREAPLWDPPLAPVLPPARVEEKRQAPRYQSGEIIRLRGVIVDSADAQLSRLRTGVQDHRYVNVDLSQLTRIAPGAAATLIGLINECAERGQLVRLLCPNVLVETLLQALSPDARVELIRAQ